MTGFAENTGVAEAVGTAILILYVISQIGFSGANLYYDSFLPDVTTEERMDRVSTMGYGLAISAAPPSAAHFSCDERRGRGYAVLPVFHLRLTAVWWAAFSWPLLKNVEQKSYQPTKRAPFARPAGAVGHAEGHLRP